MTIYLYLIGMVFNQGIEKNYPSERGCQTKSTLCPRSKWLCLIWVENLDGYSMFLVTLPFTIEILEVNGHKLHLEQHQKMKRMGHTI